MLKKIPRTIVCVAAQGEELGKDGIEYVLCDKTCNRCIVREAVIYVLADFVR